MRIRLLVLACVVAAVAPAAQAYPEFEVWVEQHSGRYVNCALCHTHPDEPEGVKPGQIRSLSALTAWLPTYWTEFYGLSLVFAGTLTAVYAILTSAIRILGGILADRLQEGGENTGILALFIMLAGALVMTVAQEYQLAVPGVILMAIGMGVANAAVFKIVPQAVPKAVGGAAGWVGGLGAFGGFAIPPILGFVVRDLGEPGYAIGFVVFVFLALLSLGMIWILKYIPEEAAEGEEQGPMADAP